MISAQKGFFWYYPPSTSAERGGRQVVQSASSGAAAANNAVFTGLTTPPEGDVMVTFEALAQDVFVRFKTANSAAATTNANGMIVKAGTKERWYLSPLTHVYVDHICPAGGGTLKWYVSSPVYEHYKEAGT